MPLLRVWLEGVDYPETDPLLIQLHMTDDGDPVRDEAILGLCGDFYDGDNRYPFVLMPNGTLHFGAYLKKQKRRFWRFRWGDRVEVGEGAVVTDADDDYPYRITRTERLSAPFPKYGDVFCAELGTV